MQNTMSIVHHGEKLGKALQKRRAKKITMTWSQPKHLRFKTILNTIIVEILCRFQTYCVRFYELHFNLFSMKVVVPSTNAEATTTKFLQLPASYHHI